MGEAQDWGTGLPLKADMLGRMNRLEVHHAYPKAKLYEQDHARAEVNALANLCFLTKETNLSISDRLPEEYFPQVEATHPGALASQWIPMDPALWKIERYLEFLDARRDHHRQQDLAAAHGKQSVAQDHRRGEIQRRYADRRNQNSRRRLITPSPKIGHDSQGRLICLYAQKCITIMRTEHIPSLDH